MGYQALSTEVLDRMNQKHNRSSSPFTTLAEQTERKVASTGAGQPNIDQRHDSELMHILPSWGCRSVPQSCSGFCLAAHMCSYRAPGNWSRGM